MLHHKTLYHFFRETAWIGVTAAASAAVLYPIVQKLDFLYYPQFFLFVFVSLQYFRWTLTLRSLPFLQSALVRFGVFSVNLILAVYIINQEQKFLGLMNNYYVEDFGFLKQGVFMFDDVRKELMQYIYLIIVLFGTGSALMIAAFNVRLLISWWQFYKYRAGVLMDD